MLCAPIPENERTRLETLRGLNLLDTVAEERFDRITRLAKRLFGVSVCLVSLVDEDRQWFKSVQGIEVEQTGRDISFCGHAIMQHDVFVIEDTFKDTRFADNPLVAEPPNIRFYAGYPLTMPNKVCIGTLCIIDDKPREFSQSDRQSLIDFGHLVEAEINAIQQTTLDALTAISNRKGFEILAKQVIANCDRQGIGSSLLFFDLDHFKKINDQFGHAEGDKALQQFAGLLLDGFRESDVIARFAGDEFIVLLNYEAEFNLDLILKRFDALVNTHNQENDLPYKLVYSTGVAHRAHNSNMSLHEYLDKADKAMFAVKALHHK